MHARVFGNPRILALADLRSAPHRGSRSRYLEASSLNDVHSPAPTGAITLAVAAIVIIRFAFRELRERKIKLSRLFIVPVVFGLIDALVIAGAAFGAPHALGLLALELIVAAAVGGGAGLGSAHFTTLRLAPEPGFVYTRGSYVTLAIWVGALALRMLVRFVGAHDQADELIANAATITLLAVAITVVRYRVLIEARIAAARGITTDLSAI